MKICVYGASSDIIDKEFITEGELLGEKMAKRGHSLVFGGGASGLMGAVARGVSRGNSDIIGIAPSFFNVDGVLFILYIAILSFLLFLNFILRFPSHHTPEQYQAFQGFLRSPQEPDEA